ncbi:MAG: recombinase RecT [Candidatus Saccharibacteria bacterium]|nr:recombinase RecT [Candidatus Saccharibacteria bacterium]
MSNNELTTTASTGGFMSVATLEQALKCSEYIAQSSFCPQVFRGKPGDVLVCLQMGQELGLKPMQALQNIAVINGRPSLWGDAMLAVCRQSPEFEYINENVKEDTMVATCVIKRKNEPEFVSTFSKEDAKVASLWGKQGPWTQYPKRMLQMRARGFCLRDSFPDLLRGIISSEEAQDIPAANYDGAPAKKARRGDIVAGEVVRQDLVTEEQIKILREAIAATKTEEKGICAYLRIPALELMHAESFSDVMLQLEKKAAKQQMKDAGHAEDAVVADFFAESEDEEELTQAEKIAKNL